MHYSRLSQRARYWTQGSLFLSGCLSLNAAMAAEATSLADVADNLLFGASMVTDFLHGVCLVLGVGFIVYAIIAYRTHRQNPKLMPLDRPIIYLVLGLVLGAIPFLDYLLGETGGQYVNRTYGGFNN